MGSGRCATAGAVSSTGRRGGSPSCCVWVVLGVSASERGTLRIGVTAAVDPFRRWLSGLAGTRCGVTTGADLVLAIVAGVVAGREGAALSGAAGGGADGAGVGSRTAKPTDSAALICVFEGSRVDQDAKARVCAAADSSRNLRMMWLRATRFS